MQIRRSIARLLFADILDGLAREASESDRGWTPVGESLTRDLPYGDHRENIAASLEAYRVNPLAFRLIELTTDFVLGRGMRLRGEGEAAQSFADEWWRHPQNNMTLRQFALCTELSLAGELFITLHTNPFDGMTYIRAIPAGSVDEIETNPEDVEDELRFHAVSSGDLTADLSQRRGALEGGRWWSKEDCRHYAINRPIGTVRGQGDLVPELTWLRRYKDWLTDRARINKFKGAFLWDVTMKGATRQQIVARQSQLASPPSPGSVLVHNEAEEWKACQPRIDAQSVEADGKALRLMVAAGAGIPLHYLAEGESATRTTAAEMGTPTFRHFQRRQLFVGALVCDLVTVAAQRSGRFGVTPRFSAVFQDVSPLDNLKLAQAAALISRGLAQAVEQGILAKAEAAALFERYFREPLADQ